MEEIYRVAFFGHREVDNMRNLETRLMTVLKRIMGEHTYIEFYIGRNGEFDEIAASVIKRLKKERDNKLAQSQYKRRFYF